MNTPKKAAAPPVSTAPMTHVAASAVAPLALPTRALVTSVAERVLWTAVQAFIGSLPVTVALTGHDLAAVANAGIAAAISAVVSLAKNLTLASNTP